MSQYGKFQKTQRKAADKEAAKHTAYLASDDHLEAMADMATERATRNALSYDAEAFDEMMRESELGDCDHPVEGTIFDRSL
jgi:hypothetical protein